MNASVAKYRMYGSFQMGDQVVQKVGLSDKVKKKKGTSDGTKFLSPVQTLFVPLHSGQDCTRGRWEMK